MKPPARIIVQLIHIHGSLKGEIQEFSEELISIGRLPSSSVHFKNSEQDLMVSRNHASIQREGNKFKLVDTSKFGTFVNGKQVKEAYLRNGDVLEFGPGGPKVSFQMEIAEGGVETVKTPWLRNELAIEVPVDQKSPVSPGESPMVENFDSVPVQGSGHLEERQPVMDPGVQATTPVQKISVPLVIQFGPTIRTYKELPVIVGSDSGCDFVIAHDGIIGKHAQLFFSLGRYWIKDLTGQNMIRINQNRIEFQSQLQAMDEIKFSPSGPILKFLGDGRFSEVEEMPEEPLRAGNSNEKNDANGKMPTQQEEGNFFFRLMKGFKK